MHTFVFELPPDTALGRAPRIAALQSCPRTTDLGSGIPLLKENTMKFLKNMCRAIVKAQEMRAQVWQLNNLTDAELRDIGINRCDIMRTVYASK